MNRLTHFPLCPFSRSIRLVLRELQIKVELWEELPWAWRPEFLATNPAGNLPVLELDNRMVLCGYYPIAEYLSDIYKTHPVDGLSVPLFPGDAESRAESRRLVDWFHVKCHNEVTSPLMYQRFFARAANVPGHTPDSQVLLAAAQNLKQHLHYVGFLVDYRHWLSGEVLTFADLAAAGQISCLDYLGAVAWDEHPSTRDWYMRLKSRPSFASLLNDRVPGLAPPDYYEDPDF